MEQQSAPRGADDARTATPHPSPAPAGPDPSPAPAVPDPSPDPSVPAPAVSAPAVPAPAVPAPSVPAPSASDPTPAPVAPPATAGGRWWRALRPALTRGQLLAATLCALLGFALVVQVRQTQEQGLDSLRQSELVNVLDNITRDSQRLDDESLELQTTLNRLESGSGDSQAARDAARQRLEVLGILAGTVPAVGPGVELAVVDPRRQVDASILLDAVQELRDAGAEAVQVQDVRVVAATAFVDGAGGVSAGGRPLSPPYTFKVIGDPQTLAAALDIPGGVLDVLRGKGAEGRVSTPSSVTVDALHRLTPAQYARPAPGVG